MSVSKNLYNYVLNTMSVNGNEKITILGKLVNYICTILISWS